MTSKRPVVCKNQKRRAKVGLWEEIVVWNFSTIVGALNQGKFTFLSHMSYPIADIGGADFHFPKNCRVSASLLQGNGIRAPSIWVKPCLKNIFWLVRNRGSSFPEPSAFWNV